MTDTDDLKALGDMANPGQYQEDWPRADILERFEAPTWKDLQMNPTGAQQVDIKVDEFTSLCPKTGQPDFATIVINYSPKQWCVESKSLKLYMFAFRNFGEFHEACVHRILNDLVKLLDPWFIKVQGQFTPRGGIPFWPSQTWQHPELVRIAQQQVGGNILVPGR